MDMKSLASAICQVFENMEKIVTMRAIKLSECC